MVPTDLCEDTQLLEKILPSVIDANKNEFTALAYSQSNLNLNELTVPVLIVENCSWGPAGVHFMASQKNFDRKS